MLIPSISILPEQSSTILDIERHMVDFPAPVRPTTPTLVPGSTTKLRFLSTSSVVGRYLKEALKNSIWPTDGHFLPSSLTSASAAS